MCRCMCRCFNLVSSFLIICVFSIGEEGGRANFEGVLLFWGHRKVRWDIPYRRREFDSLAWLYDLRCILLLYYYLRCDMPYIYDEALLGVNGWMNR